MVIVSPDPFKVTCGKLILPLFITGDINHIIYKVAIYGCMTKFSFTPISPEGPPAGEAGDFQKFLFFSSF